MSASIGASLNLDWAAAGAVPLAQTISATRAPRAMTAGRRTWSVMSGPPFGVIRVVPGRPAGNGPNSEGSLGGLGRAVKSAGPLRGVRRESRDGSGRSADDAQDGRVPARAVGRPGIDDLPALDDVEPARLGWHVVDVRLGDQDGATLARDGRDARGDLPRRWPARAPRRARRGGAARGRAPGRARWPASCARRRTGGGRRAPHIREAAGRRRRRDRSARRRGGPRAGSRWRSRRSRPR